MKKPIIIGAAFGAAAVLASPLITSNYGQSQLTEMAASIDALPFYSVSVEQTSKGYLTSESQITFAIDLSDLFAQQDFDTEDFDAEPLSFTFNVQMNHGIVLLGDNPGLGLVSWTSTLVDDELRESMQWQEGTPLYVQNGQVSLFGEMQLTETIEAFTVTSETEFGDVFELAFSGMQGMGSYADQQFSYSALIDSITAGDSEVDIAMQSLDFQLENQGTLASMLEGAVSPSEVIGKVASFKVVTAEEGEVFSSDNLSVSGITSIDESNNLINIAVGYDIDVLTVIDYTINNFHLDMAFNNIDAKFVEMYNELTQSAYTLPPEEMSAKFMAFFENDSLAFFQAEPEFKIESLKAELPDGNFSANAVSSLKGIQALPANIDDQEFWLKHIFADATVTADATLANALAIQYMTSQLANDPQAAELSAEQISEIAAQQAPQILDMFAQQGLLVLDGEQYTSHAHMEEGTFTLNGNVIPLPTN